MPRGVPNKPIVDDSVHVTWKEREGWRSWGDRFHFLSNEGQHALTGKLSVLPPRGLKKRVRE